MEGDYFDELRGPEIIMDDDLCDNDYDLDMSNDADEHSVTSQVAARLFGGDDGYQTYVREQRGSMTIGTDTLSEIDSRSSEAIPLKEMASPVDSTLRVLPQLVGLGGQTEPLQAQTETNRGITEKESPLESLARGLLTEL